MTARLIAVLPAFDGVSGELLREGNRASAKCGIEKSDASLWVPLWVAMGIAGAAAMLPFYGTAIWALPALAFLVACPLLVAWVLLIEGETAPDA